MAVTATFSSGTLTVLGDALGNTLTVSRDAAGNLLVNGGAVNIQGGLPTAGNTSLIQMFGQSGADRISLDESSGALPAANLFGGFGNDTLIGGSGGDQLFGQFNNDLLLGMAGNDTLRGGDNNDTLIGGTGDDQLFGEAGDDRLIWNDGDGSDLMEGGDGLDTAEVNGGDGAESFTITANGARVRFDRLDATPFALDIGTTETLVLNMGDGDDSIAATGNLAALIRIAVDGGDGNDTILGSNGGDTLAGGDGNDFIDGQQGNDSVRLGAGDDAFQWDPGDGNDVIEGDAGVDTIFFNASNIGEAIEISANGERGLLTRNIAAITMDFDNVEVIRLRALGGADSIVVHDLSATDVLEVSLDLRSFDLHGDGQSDTVTAHGSSGGDAIEIVAAGDTVTVAGLSALISMQGFEAGDRLAVHGDDGNDLISASAVPAGAMVLTLDGGAGNDTLAGSSGGDALLGGAGNDLLDGGAGIDILDGGTGNDTYIFDGSDLVIEDFDAGIDTVKSLLNTAELGANLENLAFIGTGNFAGTGNSFNNIISGGAGNDTLDGADGNDRLIGAGGADFLNGSEGNDIITGGFGADTMTGGFGDDRFDYTALRQGGDLITDFHNAVGDNDMLRFTGSVFGGLARGMLDASRFVANTEGVATTLDQRFIYETDTGILRFDANGSAAGGVRVIATLTDAPLLTADDFLII